MFQTYFIFKHNTSHTTIFVIVCYYLYCMYLTHIASMHKYVYYSSSKLKYKQTSKQ